MVPEVSDRPRDDREVSDHLLSSQAIPVVIHADFWVEDVNLDG